MAGSYQSCGAPLGAMSEGFVGDCHMIGLLAGALMHMAMPSRHPRFTCPISGASLVSWPFRFQLKRLALFVRCEALCVT